MTNTQLQIDAMYKGNKEIIIEGIFSKSQIVVANAIIAGAQQSIKEPKFVAELKNLVNDTEIVLMGIPVSSIATAALDILGIIKYKGNDEYIQSLISSKLAF